MSSGYGTGMGIVTKEKGMGMRSWEWEPIDIIAAGLSFDRLRPHTQPLR
jgi:hypothetical protein